MAGRQRAGSGPLQRHQRISQHSHRAGILVDRTRAYSRHSPLRHQGSHSREPARDGGIFIAQHQQATSPRTPAQHTPRMEHIADTRRLRQPCGEDQHRQRPRHTHMQVDARMAEVGRRHYPRKSRQEGRPSHRRLLRALRQAFQGRGGPAHGAEADDQGGGRSRIAADAGGARHAPPLGGKRSRGARTVGDDEPLGLRRIRPDLRPHGSGLRQDLLRKPDLSRRQREGARRTRRRQDVPQGGRIGMGRPHRPGTRP